MPEQLQTSIARVADENLSAADRANGVVAAWSVDWRGIAHDARGVATDVQGSFALRRLASRTWFWSEGYRQTLLQDDGTFATTGEDLSGLYTGQTEAHGYDGIEMELQRSGASHSGTFRYRYYGTARTFRIVALHRLASRDPYSQSLNGAVQLWYHEDGTGKDADLLPNRAVALGQDGIAFTWIPPRDPVVVTLRRR